MNGVQVSYSPLLGPVNYTVFPGPHVSKWQIQGLIAERTCPHPSTECLASEGLRTPGPEWSLEGITPFRESTLSSLLSLQGSRGQALGPSD